MPAYLAHIKKSDYLFKAMDFMNSIAIDFDKEDTDNIYSYPKKDYQLLLYKSQALNKYLTIDFDPFSNNMKVAVEKGTSLKLEIPLTQNIDTTLVKQDFDALLNSNREWGFKQAYNFKNFASGFFNENIQVHKWDMYSDSNELLGIKVLIQYDNLTDVQDFNSTLVDIVMSEYNVTSYYDLVKDNDVAQKLLTIVL